MLSFTNSKDVNNCSDMYSYYDADNRNHQEDVYHINFDPKNTSFF
jgi:hypothetical protein